MEMEFHGWMAGDWRKRWRLLLILLLRLPVIWESSKLSPHRRFNLSSQCSRNENDDNDEAFNGEDAANLKSTHQTSKKLAPGLERTGRGHKKASEGSETLDQEPPKKKFSHSPRRNKRRGFA